MKKNKSESLYEQKKKIAIKEGWFGSFDHVDRTIVIPDRR